MFLGGFWQEMFKLLGTKLHYSSSYHPQSDGQSERVNQCLETYLRCMCIEHPTQWSVWLSTVEFWYNTNFHTSLHLSPFEALYGYKPTHIPLGPFHDSVIPTAADMVQERLQIMSQIKRNLAKAQNRMKHYADKHKTERNLQVGEWVFLKLQSYRQQTVAVRRNLKLSAKYFGPFQIIKKVGAVAYKLQLSPGARVHPVFHVSLLKKKIGDTQTPGPVLPELDSSDQCLLQPERVMKRRVTMIDSQPVIQYLVKWNHLPDSEASWKDKSFIDKMFPGFKA